MQIVGTLLNAWLLEQISNQQHQRKDNILNGEFKHNVPIGKMTVAASRITS